MDRFTIRLASKKDARAILQVNYKTWQTTYKGIIDDAFMASHWDHFDEALERFTSRFDAPSTTIFVAEIDGQIAGFANAGDDRSGQYDGELFALYVLDDFHGIGIGHALLKRVETLFHAQGKKTMIIWSLKDNPYHGFYERNGGVKTLEKDIEIGDQTLRVYGFVFEY